MCVNCIAADHARATRVNGYMYRHAHPLTMAEAESEVDAYWGVDQPRIEHERWQMLVMGADQTAHFPAKPYGSQCSTCKKYRDVIDWPYNALIQDTFPVCVCIQTVCCYAFVKVDDARVCTHCHRCLNTGGSHVGFDSYGQGFRFTARRGCSCIVCESCSERSSRAHTGCDQCNSCCEHPTCGNCDQRCNDADYCHDCSRGTDCCSHRASCPTMNNGIVMTGARRVIFNKGEATTTYPLKRMAALEIEVCSVPRGKGAGVNSAAANWNVGIVRDGSICSTGFELNMQPASGDRFEGQLLDLTKSLVGGVAHRNGGGCQGAGVHCHVDSKDMSYAQLRNLVALYCRLEEGMFALCFPERRDGHYAQLCAEHYRSTILKAKTGAHMRSSVDKSIYNRVATLKGLRERYGKDWVEGRDKAALDRALTLEKATLDELKRTKYVDARYKALNLHSWFLRGTVEFRHHHGSVDYTTLRNWALVCGTLVETALTNQFETCDAWPTGLPGIKQLVPSIAEWVEAESKAVKNP